MKTMRSVRIYGYGGTEVLVYEDAPCPRPQAGEVLVRVHAAGINPIDCKMREGHFNGMIPIEFPLVLGWDVSGVVESVGPGVDRLAVGDEVFSRPDMSRDGAYAEYIVIAESEVALKPKSVDHIHAAAMPMAGLAAWQALFDAAGLSPGQHVLIHGAAGGVGHLAIQLAKWKGAYVIATASAHQHLFVRKLGADRIIDYDTERFEEVVQPVDVVFDTIGGDVQDRSWKVLKRGGILVSIVSPPSTETAAEHEVRQAFVMGQANADQLAQIAKLAEAEKLKVIVETVLALSDATRGQELSERGNTSGKIVLRVIEPDA
jgi:NADPH:quinone reductase-like Zn-dependent oxidoreductase